MSVERTTHNPSCGYREMLAGMCPFERAYDLGNFCNKTGSLYSEPLSAGPKNPVDKTLFSSFITLLSGEISKLSALTVPDVKTQKAGRVALATLALGITAIFARKSIQARGSHLYSKLKAKAEQAQQSVAAFAKNNATTLKVIAVIGAIELFAIGVTKLVKEHSMPNPMNPEFTKWLRLQASVLETHFGLTKDPELREEQRSSYQAFYNCVYGEPTQPGPISAEFIKWQDSQEPSFETNFRLAQDDPELTDVQLSAYRTFFNLVYPNNPKNPEFPDQ